MLKAFSANFLTQLVFYLAFNFQYIITWMQVFRHMPEVQVFHDKWFSSCFTIKLYRNSAKKYCFQVFQNFQHAPCNYSVDVQWQMYHKSISVTKLLVKYLKYLIHLWIILSNVFQLRNCSYCPVIFDQSKQRTQTR